MPDPQLLRVLVADDEAPARAKVRRMLDADPEIGTVYEARDGVAALGVIRDEAPDIALMDIEMPGMTGLEVVAALSPGSAPHVVFLTAYDAFAVKAFELEAVDYLLKPFDAERFSVAMARARRALAADQRQADLARLVAMLQTRPAVSAGGGGGSPGGGGGGGGDRLAVEDGGRRVLVRYADIDRLEASGGRVRVHVGARIRSVRGTLVELERRLPAATFVRVGRGTIVNIERVHAWEPAGHGDYLLILRDGSRVRLGRRYAAGAAGRLGIRSGR